MQVKLELHTNSGSSLNGQDEKDRIIYYTYSLVYGRPHRASGALAYHVLDLMQAFDEASASGNHIPIESRCLRPAALPMGLRLGELDK